MLTSILLKNFKSIRNVELPLAQLTVLIGANASGKSNVLEGIQMLAYVADGGRLETIDAAIKDGRLHVRGPASAIEGGWQAEGGFALGCDVAAHAELFLMMRLRHTAKGLHIMYESLRDSDEPGAIPLYEVAEPAPEHTNQMRVQYNNFKKGGNKPIVTCSDQLAVFNQLVSPARFGENHPESQKRIPEACVAVQRALAAILFLDPSPAHMRGYAYTTDVRLQGNGANLSSVLHHLCTAKGKKGDVLAFVRALPEQDIRDLRFQETKRGEVLLELVETFGGAEKAWDAGVLSDGTLRVLAIAAALLSVEEGSLVVIEEIDNGVHPSRARMLLERVQAIAAERRVRVLVTTHNPALLDALPDSALGDVVACFRGEQGDSRLVRLQDLERFPELVGQGPLGTLVTAEVVDRFVKATPETAEAKRARLEAWRASLETGT